MDRQEVDTLVATLAEMDRGQLVEKIHSIHCSFTLDFSDEYLEEISLENLRHIVMAASLQELRAA